jgi:hypothetical protein
MRFGASRLAVAPRDAEFSVIKTHVSRGVLVERVTIERITHSM